MVIKTPYFGELEIDRDKIVHFEKGLPGFKEETQFVFLELPETPFFIMHSTQSELYFFVINPYLFFKDYDVTLANPVVDALDIKNQEDVVVYNIVTIKDDLNESTANLQAPIIVNAKNKKGKQVILNQTPYSIRQTIFPQTAQKASSE